MTLLVQTQHPFGQGFQRRTQMGLLGQRLGLHVVAAALIEHHGDAQPPEQQHRDNDDLMEVQLQGFQRSRQPAIAGGNQQRQLLMQKVLGRRQQQDHHQRTGHTGGDPPPTVQTSAPRLLPRSFFQGIQADAPAPGLVFPDLSRLLPCLATRTCRPLLSLGLDLASNLQSVPLPAWNLLLPQPCPGLPRGVRWQGCE
jgi:hypothetical protein